MRAMSPCMCMWGPFPTGQGACRPRNAPGATLEPRLRLGPGRRRAHPAAGNIYLGCGGGWGGRRRRTGEWGTRRADGEHQATLLSRAAGAHSLSRAHAGLQSAQSRLPRYARLLGSAGRYQPRTRARAATLPLAESPLATRHAPSSLPRHNALPRRRASPPGGVRGLAPGAACPTRQPAPALGAAATPAGSTCSGGTHRTPGVLGSGRLGRRCARRRRRRRRRLERRQRAPACAHQVRACLRLPACCGVGECVAAWLSSSRLAADVCMAAARAV